MKYKVSVLGVSFAVIVLDPSEGGLTVRASG